MMQNRYLRPTPWAVLNFFFSYLKQNRIVFIYMYLLSIVFTFMIGSAFFKLKSTIGLSPVLILTIIWSIETITFSSQNFLAILCDFKQTTIFRRIGLTRIKPIEFILVTSCFNFVVNLAANTLIFTTFAIWMHFWKPQLLPMLFSYQLGIAIIFSILFIFLISSLAFLLAIFINNRTTLNVVTFLFTFILSILIVSVIILFANLTVLFEGIKNWQIAAIIVVFYLVLIGVTALICWVAKINFQWQK